MLKASYVATWMRACVALAFLPACDCGRTHHAPIDAAPEDRDPDASTSHADASGSEAGAPDASDPDAGPATDDAGDRGDAAADAALDCGCDEVEPDDDAGIVDSDFGDASAWTTTLVSFEPDYFSEGDGIAHFQPLGLCGGSAIAQVVSLPRPEDSTPLAAVIDYYGVDPEASCYSDAVLAFDGVPQPIPMLMQNGTAQVCLGERAFEPDVELKLRAATESGCPSNIECAPRSFGGIALEPALPGTCGPIGGFGNADFAAHGTEGWSVFESTVASVEGDALVLESRNGCFEATGHNSISVPLAETLPNPVLELDVRYDLGPRGSLVTEAPYVDVALDSPWTTPLRRTALIDGVEAHIAICLPSHAAGTARSLFISGNRPSSSCYNDDGTAFYALSVSNLTLRSDPDCAAAGPDFALDAFPIDKAPWHLTSVGPGSTEIVDDAANAHSGSRVLRMEIGPDCHDGAAATSVLLEVPSEDDAGGLMLSFWHRLEGVQANTYLVSRFAQNVTLSDTWEQRQVCIDSSFEGQLVQLFWHLQPLANCQLDTEARTLWIDDIAIEPNASCLR